jgi:SAM-dependent methyltransferase
MIRTITHNNITVPEFQSKGFAAKFAFPFAKEVCIGQGCDIGCNRKEWAFVDRNGTPALMIDPAIPECRFDAFNLPPMQFDYLLSSHCLEHLGDWVKALDYWGTKLKRNGTLFLYLPHYNSTYWRPWHNRKHIHSFTPNILRDYLTDSGYKNIFVSECDLNNSFMVMAEKP